MQDAAKSIDALRVLKYGCAADGLGAVEDSDPCAFGCFLVVYSDLDVDAAPAADKALLDGGVLGGAVGGHLSGPGLGSEAEDG
ncbi:hypothetical protein PG985_000381 [Apiospora marii]|uniref:uncharacterized protein n=1 Tax=Apiospora marii TaxID=335849 RepID=UPI003130A076